MKNTKENGITLIALIITIIVLLILAGVSISALVGENGILQQTTTAANETVLAQIKEDVGYAWNSCEATYRASNIEKEDSFTKENIASNLSNYAIDYFSYDQYGDSFILLTKNNQQYCVKIDNSNNITAFEYNDPEPYLTDWAGCTECSEDNPHIISNKYDFNSIRTHINVDDEGNEYLDGYFELANDILFLDSDYEADGYFYNDGEFFIPIGLGEGPYTYLWSTPYYTTKINLNGNGYTLFNIQIYTAEGQRRYNSVFARLTTGGKLYNLNFEKIYVTAPTYCSILCNCIEEGATINNINISNSTIKTTKSMGNMGGSGIISGELSSNLENIKMTNCNINCSSWYCGIISSFIGSNTTINNIFIDNCSLGAYVESGLLAYSIDDNVFFNNINVANSYFAYWHTNSTKSGLLFNLSNGTAYLSNSNIQYTYTGTCQTLVTSGNLEITDSTIQIDSSDGSDMTISAGTGVTLTNTTIN